MLCIFINKYEEKQKKRERERKKAMCYLKMGRNQDYWFNQANYLSLKMVNTRLYQVFHVLSISKLESLRVCPILRSNKAMILLKVNYQTD